MHINKIIVVSWFLNYFDFRITWQMSTTIQPPLAITNRNNPNGKNIVLIMVFKNCNGTENLGRCYPQSTKFTKFLLCTVQVEPARMKILRGESQLTFLRKPNSLTNSIQSRRNLINFVVFERQRSKRPERGRNSCHCCKSESAARRNAQTHPAMLKGKLALYWFDWVMPFP